MVSDARLTESMSTESVPIRNLSPTETAFRRRRDERSPTRRHRRKGVGTGIAEEKMVLDRSVWPASVRWEPGIALRCLRTLETCGEFHPRPRSGAGLPFAPLSNPLAIRLISCVAGFGLVSLSLATNQLNGRMPATPGGAI